MASSIFTFDTDPQRVSSPWLSPEEPGKKDRSAQHSAPRDHLLQPGLLSEYGVTKLQAEPQEGPTEYKLHLLLRPRRVYRSATTSERAPSPQPSNMLATGVPSKPSTPTLSASSQTRQSRLQQLTTQLLWRLQQSSPYHSSNSKDLVIPKLPGDAANLSAAVRPQKLLSGLEESRGALYEIGVSDNGTLVGLTQDEMSESIATLRVMAASLGCNVEILREVIVGECEWLESSDLVDSAASHPTQIVRQGKLWVTEALVTPDLGLKNHSDAVDGNPHSPGPITTESSVPIVQPSTSRSTTDQLRVTLTGPTTSGKSTLLGTLSTGTLDNGRGKSRLSLFKHRHEVASGLTSSVAQELIGYKEDAIINYSQGHIDTWTNIHHASKNGRLVFVSDSAGHPRYRRTVLRGLIGWAPQWTVLCIAADDADANPTKDGTSSTAQDVLGHAGAAVDLAKAHLDLCLSLKTPLAVIITKLDLATKASIQRALGKVLTGIKEAGRVPRILHSTQSGEADLARIPLSDLDKARAISAEMREKGDFLEIVPIILASAVSGVGIGLTHALLDCLPLPPAPTSHDFVGLALNPEQPASLFHIDDTFSLPASYATLGAKASQNDMGTVVSGYLRFGQLSVGDNIVIGPFPSEDDDAKSSTPDDRSSPSGYGLSISHPSSAELARIAMRNAVAASTIKGEWHNAKIVSIRNLRLQVHTLEAGQVGTIGIVLDTAHENALSSVPGQRLPVTPRIRKGMVLAIPSKHMIDTGLSLQAASGLTALFDDLDTTSLTIGSLANIYVGGVRAAVRISRIWATQSQHDASSTSTEEIEETFSLNDLEDFGAISDTGAKPAGIEVAFELLTNREWIELGSQILMLEGGRKDRSGLEGFVGKVVEIVD